MGTCRGWYILAVNGWYILAVNEWYTLAVNHWYIVGCKVTAEPTSTEAQFLSWLPTVLFRCPSRTGMDTHHRAVQQQPLHIRVGDKVFQHFLLNPFVTPGRIATINAVPFTEFSQQITPLSACSHYPVDRFNKQSRFLFIFGIRTWH
jgi:hypothetical protein